MDQYRVVFDLTSTHGFWSAVLFPFTIIVPTVIFVCFWGRGFFAQHKNGNNPDKTTFKIISFLFPILFVSAMIFYGYSYFSIMSYDTYLMQQGKVLAVEGCLQGFHPMPKEGHQQELVEVNGEVFSYSTFDASTPAFNDTESHGGPIHADSAVKIWHLQNQIIRLAVRDHACAYAPDLPKNLPSSWDRNRN